MDGRKMIIGWSVVAALGCLFAAGEARATSCVNDIDCPGNAACGGDVCDYTTGTPTCKAAGSQPPGSDGWCTSSNGNADCKCASMGATCAGFSCTFTKPTGGSGSAGTTGSGGTTASGGATGSGGTGSGGTTGSAGTTGKGSTGGDASTSSGGGGCRVAGDGSPGAGLGLVAIGLAALLRRRKRA